jgi:hypothetical protein
MNTDPHSRRPYFHKFPEINPEKDEPALQAQKIVTEVLTGLEPEQLEALATVFQTAEEHVTTEVNKREAAVKNRLPSWSEPSLAQIDGNREILSLFRSYFEQITRPNNPSE